MVSCDTVRHEPRHQTALAGRVVAGWPSRSSQRRGSRRRTGPLTGGRLQRSAALKAGEGDVPVVRCDNCGVAAVGRRPVDESLSVTELGRVDRRLEQPQHPDLSTWLAVPGVEECVAA